MKFPHYLIKDLYLLSIFCIFAGTNNNNTMKKSLLLLAVTLTAIAPCHADTWDGVSSDTSWYIEGLQEYHIHNAAQLKGFADLVNNQSQEFENCTVYLEDDIDLNNKQWTPIGYIGKEFGGKSFCGNFDGQGFIISNLFIETSELPYNIGVGNAGFFGSAEENISNITIEGKIILNESSVEYHYYIGGIVANGKGIANSTSNVDIELVESYSDANYYIGGAAGYIENISCVKTMGHINTASYNILSKGHVGGIAGYSTGAILECASSSKIDLPIHGTLNIGGIVGTFYMIENCIFTGSLKINNSTNDIAFIGGIGGSHNGNSGSVFNNITIPSSFETNVSRFNGQIISVKSGDISCFYNYYLTDFDNGDEPYGEGVTSDYLKSGEALPNFDTNIWEFKEGRYPMLKALKSTYTISVPISDGRIGLNVLEGENATITITPEAGWELQSLYVDDIDYTHLMNGKKYTFENVTNNHTVSAIFKKSATGIQSVSTTEEKPSLKIVNGNVCINGLDKSTIIQVYSIDGKIVKNMSANEASKFALNKGVYIIKAGKNTFKISL